MKRDIRPHIQLHRWQIEEIEKAVNEADAGLFATDEEVEEFFDERTA